MIIFFLYYYSLKSYLYFRLFMCDLRGVYFDIRIKHIKFKLWFLKKTTFMIGHVCLFILVLSFLIYLCK